MSRVILFFAKCTYIIAILICLIFSHPTILWLGLWLLDYFKTFRFKNISTQKQSSGRGAFNVKACVFQSLHAHLFFQTLKPLDHSRFQNQLPLWLRLLRNLSHLENLIYTCDRLRNKSQKIRKPNLLHRYLKHRRLYLNRLVKERQLVQIRAGYQEVNSKSFSTEDDSTQKTQK